MQPKIAALFVERDGVYSGFPDIDLWDVERDARLYAGPYPVVCHPPCERWGRYAEGGPSAHGKYKIGDDNGCFAAALASVRKYGGVIEHPEISRAWNVFGLKTPPYHGGWIAADAYGGWTCSVDQGWYGHRAQKTTWLYAVGCELPSLHWGRFNGGQRIDAGHHRKDKENWVRPTNRLTKKQLIATPIAFRDILIQMARSYHPDKRTTWNLLSRII